MTHELVGVIVEPFITRDTAQPVVEKILAPFQEQFDETAETLSGWWDFWMIGGRWAGVWVDGYAPHLDPLNIDPRPCFICHGTGHRPDIGDWDREKYIKDFGGCNGCAGKGHAPVWPSSYRPIERDVIPVSELIEDATLRMPRRLVLPDAGVISRDDWGGDASYDPDPRWDEHVRSLLVPFSAAAIVAVDVHV